MPIFFRKLGKTYQAEGEDEAAILRELVKEPVRIIVCSKMDNGEMACAEVDRVDVASMLIGKPVRTVCDVRGGLRKCTVYLDGKKVKIKKRGLFF